MRQYFAFHHVKAGKIILLGEMPTEPKVEFSFQQICKKSNLSCFTVQIDGTKLLLGGCGQG